MIVMMIAITPSLNASSLPFPISGHSRACARPLTNRILSMPPFDPRPVVLTGDHVVLAPLALAHAADLARAGADDDTWLYMPRPALRSIEDAESMIRQATAETEAGNEVAFAI